MQRTWYVSKVTHPAENGQIEIEKAESGRHDPDVDDGDECKDNGPNKGGWDSNHGGKELVEPRLGLRKHHESQLPHPFKALSSVWFSQHIVKVELQFNKGSNFNIAIIK